MDLNRALRREFDPGAVKMRLEHHSVFVEHPQLGERHDLKAARIGQNRLVPVHEPMQPAETVNHFGAGPEHQMIGITQQDLRAGRRDGLRRHCLDGALSAHRHECRCIDDTMSRRQLAASSRAVGRAYLKAESVFAHCAVSRNSSVASPYE